MANEKTAVAVATLPKWKCRIPGAKDIALETFREVEALTAADAKEKYLETMGIIGLDHPLKVEVQGA